MLCDDMAQKKKKKKEPLLLDSMTCAVKWVEHQYTEVRRREAPKTARVVLTVCVVASASDK